MRSGQSGLLEFPNACNMLLHLLGDYRGSFPPLGDYRHQTFPLKHALTMKLNIEPLLQITFPRGLDREGYIVVCLSQGKTDQPDGQVLRIVNSRVKVMPQIYIGLNAKPGLT